jgi:hypothetical protein
MTLDKSQWEEKDIELEKFLLDEENIRLDERSRNSQDQVVRYLIEKEGALSLARQIDGYRGLFPHERVICIPADDKFIVVEGNRRICACRLLNEPRTAPTREMEAEVPIATHDTLANIQTIPAIIAATRAVANEVIASIHVYAAKHQWSDIARMKFAARQFSEGYEPERIASSLGCDPKLVLDYLRRKKIFDATLGLGAWTSQQQDILWDYKLDMAPLVEVVLSKAVKQHFGESLFSDTGEPNYLFPPFEKVFRRIVIHTLISQQMTTDRRFNSGQDISQYLSAEFGAYNQSTAPDAQDPLPLPLDPPRDKVASSQKGRQATPQSEENQIDQKQVIRHRAEQLFERLDCKQPDERMRQLFRELRRLSNDLDTFRYSISFLMRASLEYCLRYHLEHRGLWQLAKGGKKKFGLNQILQFYQANAATVFAEEEYGKKVASLLRNHALMDLDFNIHNRAGNHSPENLRLLAAEIRPILRHIGNEIQYN